MIVKLFDRTEIIVTEPQAEAIVNAIERGVKMIRINKMVIASGAIAVIKPGGHTQADIVPRNRQLAPPDNRGTDSPAKERLREMLAKKKLA